MMLYICTMFRDNISKGFKVFEQTRFISKLKFSKGNYFIKMLVELLFLFSAHCLIVLYISTKFNENISKGFKVIEQTRFQRGIIQ